MKRAQALQRDLEQIQTIQGLTAVFESIASIHIAQIKDKVVSSTAFFNELWGIYSQLRVGEGEYSRRAKPEIADRQAVIAVTSEGGLIGDIDEKIVSAMLGYEDRDKADFYIIGAHGATLLGQKGVRPVKVFALPDVEKSDSVAPIADILNKYGRATVYYQTYVSLLRQEVARIELFSAVSALGQASQAGEVISSRDYIFEPSLREIIEYMESVMVGIALGQVMLESKLAQYASRFNAMSAANSKATELRRGLDFSLHRARRGEADERTKEVLSAMKLRQP